MRISRKRRGKMLENEKGHVHVKKQKNIYKLIKTLL